MVFRLTPGKFLRLWLACSRDRRMIVQMLATIVVTAATIVQPTALAVVPQFRVQVSDTRGAAVTEAVVTLRLAESSSKSAPAARQRLPVPATPVVIQQQDREFVPRIQQQDREFVPRISIVAIGARVSLPNNDAVPHSVYSFSPAKQFEFEVYVGSSPQVLILDKVGVITLGCNIHDWMIGYIVVVDTPFAQLTDTRGSVSFSNVAEGDYELRVWHSQQRLGDHVAQISVSDAGQSQSVTVDLSPPRVRYKPPLTLKRY